MWRSVKKSSICGSPWTTRFDGATPNRDRGRRIEQRSAAPNREDVGNIKTRVYVYEHRSEAVLSRRAFLRRVFLHAILVGFILGGSVVIGVLGFRFFGGLSWMDALMNAALLLGGMGLVAELQNGTGKLFTSAYALYAGVAFLTVAAVLVAPFAHRLLHRLHLEEASNEGPNYSAAQSK